MKSVKDSISNAFDFLTQENRILHGKDVEKYAENILLVINILSDQSNHEFFMKPMDPLSRIKRVSTNPSDLNLGTILSQSSIFCFPSFF